MPNLPLSAFPADFVWGTATASYQIEGAANEDGRGESVWDRFCATPGKVRNGDNGAIACDFYHRYRDDIALMRELGIDAFRFSIAWPRVIPGGRGPVNAKGLDFYDRLIDELIGNGITPYVTLFHWDTPQSLEDEGGWPVRSTVDAFGAYVEAVAGRLGDRVSHWITHNEPWVVSWVGHGWGHHAPGRTSEADALATAHHLLLSHGRAVQILRELSPGAEVGITLNLDYAYAAGDDEGDEAAAAWVDGFHNRWFLDPIFKGAYPQDMLDAWRDVLPNIEDGDLETIAAPIDFLGVNNYTSPLVAADTDGSRSRIVHRGDVDLTDMGWEVVPDGLRDLLLRLARDYSPKAIYGTENGAAYPDVRSHDGSVGDPERQAYFEGYIGAAAEACASGVPLKGYFAWSLLDNFEWAWGYWKRFGLVYVDYATLERVPKGSFYWYRDLIAAQRAQGEDADAYAVALP
ncbi:MAG TPA: GH1 family beta-glucosidase [Gaiellaceae bacterium]|nr:GH1 family beta-glucosidase [Gaiellaceae bacterium]